VGFVSWLVRHITIINDGPFLIIMSRDISVGKGVATGCTNIGSIPCRSRDLFATKSKTSLGPLQLLIHPVGTGGSFSECEAAIAII
jgi:hypothetical protein